MGNTKIRPMYGYKRITAMVNRVRKALELPKVNKKHIYRVMKAREIHLPRQCCLVLAPEIKHE